MPALALLPFEGTRAAGVDVGPVKGHDGFAAGQEHAAVLAGFPNVVEGAQFEFDLNTARDREIELLQFLRLVSIGRGADGVRAGREQRQEIVTGRVAFRGSRRRERRARIGDRSTGDGLAGDRVNQAA